MTHTQQNLDLFRCFIQPGQLAFSKDPSLICAVCGNGVLVVVHDRILKVGGVAHCIFPKPPRDEKPSNRCVDTALTSLYACLKSMNSVNRNLEAQLFGGGDQQGYMRSRALKVVKRAQKMLGRLEIRVVSCDTGGSLGRKVIFNTESGEVIVHKTRRIRKVDWMPEFERA